MNYLNYLEDYQLAELKSMVGNEYSVNCSPTGSGKLVKVLKNKSVFEAVANEYHPELNYKIGQRWYEPNMIAWNIIG